MSTPEPSGNPGVSPREQRAADSDRKLVAERLRVALDEGRLDLSEYDERLQHTYASKTYAELDALLQDIPGAAPAATSQLETVTDKSVHGHDGTEHRLSDRKSRRKSIKQSWTGVGGMAIFFTGLWAIPWIANGGDPPYYWPIWVIGFWAVGAACYTWSRLMKD